MRYEPPHNPLAALRTTPRTGVRRGYSLLELVLAVALAAGTLTPALVIMRDGMEISRETDYRLLLTNYAVQKLEERMAVVAASWVEGTATGDLSADGFSSIRYAVTSSDEVVDGGIVNFLMSIEVTTYVDEDSDDSLDAEEPRCTFRTKIANLSSYVEAAGS
ncbi:MAG: hypothetical protein KDA37_07380 [Planctomycetales bacterium]|nr:hypothetical protein [Planctomycetales bacterium]